MRLRLLLILALLPCLLPPAQAGILFGRKKDKVDPRTRVPELVATLKADGDADKRALAADELRYYDVAAFPEILPALIHALHHDQRPAVRLEALQSLGKIRPVTQAAGDALEQALANDASMRVRLQARSTLLQYHWAGYRSGKKTDVPPLTPSKEPPLAGPDLPPAIQTTRPSERLPAAVPPPPAPVALPAPPPPATGIRGLFSGFRSTPTPVNPGMRPSTAEPPLAPPEAPASPAPALPAPPAGPALAPLPAGPTLAPPIPLPAAPPTPASSNEGPELN